MYHSDLFVLVRLRQLYSAGTASVSRRAFFCEARGSPRRDTTTAQTPVAVISRDCHPTGTNAIAGSCVQNPWGGVASSFVYEGTPKG